MQPVLVNCMCQFDYGMHFPSQTSVYEAIFFLNT